MNAGIKTESDDASPDPKNIFQCGQCYMYVQVPDGLDQASALTYFFTGYYLHTYKIKKWKILYISRP